MSDYAWLKGKLSVCDVNALLADYDCFPDDAALRRLERTLRQAAHIVSRDLDQLAGQLLGRLLDDPAPEIEFASAGQSGSTSPLPAADVGQPA